MLEFIGDCAIKICTYVANIPVRIREKQAEIDRIETVRLAQLENARRKREIEMNEIREQKRQIRRAEEAKLYLEAVVRKEADLKVKLERFNERKAYAELQELRSLALSYRHNKIDENTTINFKGVSYNMQAILRNISEE